MIEINQPHTTLVEILEAEICPDPIHMLVARPPKRSASSFRYLKGKSRLPRATPVYEDPPASPVGHFFIPPKY